VKAARIARKEKDSIWRSANRESLNALNREWYAKNKEKIAITHKLYRENNKERNQERHKIYSKENRVKIRDATRARYQENPEKMLSIKHEWIAKNKEYYRARSAEYESVKRCTVKQATPVCANKFFMREIYHLAQLRTKCLGIRHSVDHIVPLQSAIVCGLHIENNLRVIQSKANISKGNRFWPDMP